jgi:hypothetical protein
MSEIEILRQLTEVRRGAALRWDSFRIAEYGHFYGRAIRPMRGVHIWPGPVTGRRDLHPVGFTDPDCRQGVGNFSSQVKLRVPV